MRSMYDSTEANDIPTTATMVAGYLAPSRYAWSAADWARFPRAVKVRIAIFASVNDGHVLDVEPGDATPAQAPGWVRMRRAAGVDPTVYCNASTWATVRAEFKRQGVKEPHYWIAKYDGEPTIPAGAVAKQFANPPVHGAGHFDMSIVADYWPGVDKPHEENDVELNTPWDPAAITKAGPGKVGHMFLGVDENVEAIRKMVDTVEPQLAAIKTAIAALANDPDIDPATLGRLIDTAVAAHTPSAEQVGAAILPLLSQVVKDVMGEDNAATADAVVDELVKRLGNNGGN